MIIYQLTTNLAERLSVIYFAYCLKIICKNMLLVVHEFRNIFFFYFFVSCADRKNIYFALEEAL